jgi:hypothetical protein
MEKVASVSLHPYFKVRPGQAAAVRALLDTFVAKTQSESECLYYEFTQDADTVFCREAYRSAKGVLHHLENVGPELGRMLELSDLIRLEIHGPESELESLRQPLSHLPVQWFSWLCGVERDTP